MAYLSPVVVFTLVWLRHDLESFKRRLKALEEKIARDGIELTDPQIAALERKVSDEGLW